MREFSGKNAAELFEWVRLGNIEALREYPGSFIVSYGSETLIDYARRCRETSIGVDRILRLLKRRTPKVISGKGAMPRPKRVRRKKSFRDDGAGVPGEN